MQSQQSLHCFHICKEQEGSEYQNFMSWSKCIASPNVVMHVVNVLKFQTLLFLFSNKMWVSGQEFTNFLSEYQIGKTLIRLLLQKQKQSDLCLPYLS